MKIKDLNIISFGKLKDKSITLSDNLNIIYGPNESGKSTISAFIEAMLYSFPPRDENRKKYSPWDNSLPSGIMTVSHENRDYKIYRSFGDTPKADTLSTDPPLSFDFLPDREAYRKSVYCREGEATEFDKTSSMDSKIANIMASGDENINAQKAIERLKDDKKVYVKQRGAQGILQETESKITHLENELTIARFTENSFKKQKEELAKKEQAILNLTDEISRLEKETEELTSNLNEIKLNILSQEEYIASLPDTPPVKPHKLSVPFLLLYIIFTVVLFIIGFQFFKPLMFLSPLPVVLYLIFFFTKKLRNVSEKSANTNEKDEATADLKKLKGEEALLISTISRNNQAVNSMQKEIIEENDSLRQLDKEIYIAEEQSCDEIEAELLYNRSLKETYTKDVKAIDAALEAIEYAKKRFSEDFTPAVTKKAMEYISLIAPKDGRRVELSMNVGHSKQQKELSLSVTDPLPRALSSYSFGFTQEVYLAFRLALSEFLYPAELPVILDDPFLGSDDIREKAIIDLLQKIAQTRQVIVFTNRKNQYFTQLNCNFVDITW